MIECPFTLDLFGEAEAAPAGLPESEYTQGYIKAVSAMFDEAGEMLGYTKRPAPPQKTAPTVDNTVNGTADVGAVADVKRGEMAAELVRARFLHELRRAGRNAEVEVWTNFVFAFPRLDLRAAARVCNGLLGRVVPDSPEPTQQDWLSAAVMLTGEGIGE